MLEIGQDVYVVQRGAARGLSVVIPRVNACKVNVTNKVLSSDKTEYILDGDFSEFVPEEQIHQAEEEALLVARKILSNALAALNNSAVEVSKEIQDIEHRLNSVRDNKLTDFAQ